MMISVAIKLKPERIRSFLESMNKELSTDLL